MTRRYSLLLMFLIVTVALPLHAQTGGCIDSPEAPTVALALVGGVGALVARLRLSRHR
jgi:XrtJ-associated TM-motif-TM protein